MFNKSFSAFFTAIFIVIILTGSAYCQTSQQLKLKTGFNFVSFTIAPSITITDFKTQNTTVEDIYLYSAAAGGFLSYSESTLTSIGAGKGYIIKSNSEPTIDMSGDALGSINDIKLKQGFNLVGFSKMPETITFSELMTRYSSVKGLYSWSSAAGSFISVALNSSTGVIELLDSTDPTLAAGKSYFVNMGEDANLNYDGSSITISGGSQPAAVSTPVINPAGGTYASAQTVSITCATIGAAIKYTLDGSDPIAGGLDYTAEITVSATSTLKAAAAKTGMTNSATATASFTINTTPPTPGLTDITISGFNKKALMAINTSGLATGGGTDAVGVLPASVNGPAKMIFNFGPSKIGAKDRSFPGRAPLNQASGRTRPIATENSATYTFKVSAGTSYKDLATTKVYGTTTSKCLIFLDDSVPTTYSWETIGQKFDNEIYAKMTGAFGDPTDIDSNGKVIILYYDMGLSESGTYGFFSPDDLTLGSGGNEMEAFYMNIKFQIEAGSAATANPLDPEMIRTLSHEFQHLINHGQRVMISKVAGMDSWMDEGLAESAEQLVGGTPGASRINNFKTDSDNKIRNGAPLCVWMGDGEAYALSYTFMQYCKNHSPAKESMFKLLISNVNGDYRAVESVMKAQNSSFTDFASVITGYRIANMVNAASGIYGYGDERATFDFSASAFAPASLENLKLAPGGNIYIYPSDSDIGSFSPNGQGANIKFIRINK